MSESERARWFAEEVLPHEPALRAYLRHRFPTMQDVDDVVQDAYVQLLRQRPATKIESVRSYLFTIAHNAVLRLGRRRAFWSDVPVAELPEERLGESDLDARELATSRLDEWLLAEAIAQLPGRCREVFKLRVLLGMSHADIAQQLGLAEATVRVQLARGIEKCTQYLREREGARAS
jgi:RNA polymerase sigma-70 factor (ECF subfamily)